MVATGFLATVLGAGLTPTAFGGSAAADDRGLRITVDLDGEKSIRPSEISRFYCHDFDFPAIHCFTTPELLENATGGGQEAFLAGVTYVTVYEHNAYAGSYMHVSEDYDTLFWIGWNDKISSFKAKNSESGHFATDWYGAGTWWSFCCNSSVSSLGSYNDTFTSVYRD